MDITNKNHVTLSRIIYFLFLSIIILGCKSKTVNVLTPTVTKINGKWEVVNSSFLPFEHISFCDKLELGAIFNFQINGKLKVYNKGEKESCNDEQYFELDSTQIVIQEWDMIFNYEINKLSTDTLIFKINRIPSYMFEDSLDVKIRSKINIDDPSFYRRIKTEGIIVELVKKVED